MLGKLIKFDMKNLGTSMFPMYLCLLLIALADRIFQLLEKSKAFSGKETVWLIAGTTHTLSLIGAFLLFAMLLIVAIRYYRSNMMEDQGYLMHTLPVTSYQLVAGKLLAVLLYVPVTALVSYLVLALSWGKLFGAGTVYDTFLSFMGKKKAICWCVILIIYILINFMYLIQAAYLSFSVAFTSVARNRNLAAGAIFVLLYNLGKYGELFVVCALSLTGGISEMDLAEITIRELLLLCVPNGIIYLVLSAGCYLITGRWLQKRLNID